MRPHVPSDTYVMPAFVKLLVADVAASARFYEALGFERRGTDGVHVHVRWARFADLLLVPTPAGVTLSGKKGLGVLLGYDASGVDLETLARQAAEAGGSAEGPRELPWGTREVVVVDLDGYRIDFVAPGQGRAETVTEPTLVSA